MGLGPLRQEKKEEGNKENFLATFQDKDAFIRECPFCGGYTLLKNPMPNTSGQFLIPFVESENGTKFKCNYCHAQGLKANNKEVAIEKWNNRVPPNDNSCPFCGSNVFERRTC